MDKFLNLLHRDPVFAQVGAVHNVTKDISLAHLEQPQICTHECKQIMAVHVAKPKSAALVVRLSQQLRHSQLALITLTSNQQNEQCLIVSI